jgi:hypothetical protein
MGASVPQLWENIILRLHVSTVLAIYLCNKNESLKEDGIPVSVQQE